MDDVLTKRNGPVHVHLSDDASLHVHILEKDKHDNSDSRVKQASNSVTKSGNLRKGPWIPPPAKTSKNYKPQSDDYTWNFEEAQLARTCRYEAKIQSLLSQLEALKGERITRKNLDLLHESQAALQQQAFELDDCKERLESTTRQLGILQATIDRLTESADSHPSGSLTNLNDSLLRCLIESELASEALLSGANNYLRACQNSHSSSHLGSLREDLDLRVHDFEDVSSRLCHLLRSRANRSLDGSRWQKEREDWQAKLEELEDLNSHWQNELSKRERELSELEVRLHRQKEDDASVSNMRHNMEVSKQYLEEHLEQKRRECERLRDSLAKQEAHSTRLEYDLDQMRQDLERHLAHQQMALEQEESLTNLKQALRRKEKQLKSVEETLQERDSTLDTYQIWRQSLDCVDNLSMTNSLLSDSDSCQEVERLEERIRHSDVEKQRLVSHEEDRKSQMETLQQRFALLELNLKRKSDDLESLSVEKSADFINLQEENHRLRHLLNQCELRLTDVDGEMTELRDNLRHYEQLVMEYRGKEDRNELKWKDRLERSQSEAKEVHQAMDRLQSQLQASESHKVELISRLSAVEGELTNLRRRCDDLQHENSSQRIQLEETLTQEKRSVEKQRSRESVANREHQSSMQESEAEIARLRAENKRILLESEEQQRRHLSRMQDLKIQLEQSDITNRSMQTYVNFLKRSYANVFGRHLASPLSYFEQSSVNPISHTATSTPMQFDPAFGSFGSLFPSPSVSIS